MRITGCTDRGNLSLEFDIEFLFEASCLGLRSGFERLGLLPSPVRLAAILGYGSTVVIDTAPKLDMLPRSYAHGGLTFGAHIWSARGRARQGGKNRFVVLCRLND